MIIRRKDAERNIWLLNFGQSLDILGKQGILLSTDIHE